jgi:hypothetical protein
MQKEDRKNPVDMEDMGPVPNVEEDKVPENSEADTGVVGDQDAGESTGNTKVSKEVEELIGRFQNRKVPAGVKKKLSKAVKMDEMHEDEGGTPVYQILRQLYRNLGPAKMDPRMQKGQLVIWRNGLKNRNLPDEANVMVILETYDTPHIETQIPISAVNAREELTLKVGAVISNPNLGAEFIEFMINHRRVKVWKEK